MERGANRKAQEEELRRIERRIRRTLDVLLDSDHEPTSLVAELNDLERKKEELERSLIAPADDRPLFHPNLAEVYRRKVADLQAALRDGSTRTHAMELIRGLVEEIRLVPENGTLRVDVKGELAGILTLCDAGKKKPGQADLTGLVEQIKMVAGIGFEPMTFRL